MNKLDIYEETIIIPTYEVGEYNKNPMFYEQRVYQGSSGKVYPLPIIDKISNEKVNKEYKVVYLENKYLKIMVMTSLGGRVQRALDKTNNYDFIYFNEVIKPALVGLAGPWISGGIEFNWPQHHRPTTFMPVEYIVKKNKEKVTLIISDRDLINGTRMTAEYNLYSDKAYLEVKVNLYNTTNMPQSFLWWANPAVSVNKYTKSIFPPDVSYVFDHGKKDFINFPLANGEYYKIKYKNTDISRYKNIPVPTSYMAYKSEYDFLGNYDYKKQAGFLHIADHNYAPGKKQWTWGNGDFGHIWDSFLTDNNGPYIELMAGVYTDNQPDFTVFQPNEVKSFSQYFLPYKKLGNVKNASKDLILNVEDKKIMLYATSIMKQLKIEIITEKSIE
ncbi:MAG: DUF5107 domain-containing protein, partial [Bacillales bacterium]|nr:DUF5107 domain-containing protein [Bacillales bacterium]